MLKYSNLKFSQSRDRFIYTVSLCLSGSKLSTDDELFLSQLHKHGVLGSKLFDLMNYFLYVSDHVSKSNIELLYGEVYNYCQNNDEYETAVIMDDIFFHNYDLKSAEVCSAIIGFVTMLDCFYGDGIVDYIDHNNKKVIHTELYPGSIMTPIDLMAYCIMRAYYDAQVKLGTPNGVNVTDLIASKSNYTLTSLILGSSCVNSLQSVKDKNEIIKHASNTRSNVCVINCSGHYRVTPQLFKMYQFTPCIWDREDFTGTSQEALTAKLLIDFCKSDLLRNRSVLLREKGVIVKRRNGQPLFDNVMYVCMREDHYFEKDIHNIIIDMVFSKDNQVRELVLDIKNTHSSKLNLLFGIDIPCVALLHVILGINTIDKYAFEELKRDFKSEDDYEEFVRLAEDSLQKLNDTFNIDDLIFEEPTSWNDYNKSNKTRKSGSGEVLFTVIETIGNYTRNLPVGQMPSENAIKLAKNYCMDLPDGKTFVSEFTRKRDVRAKQGSGLDSLLKASQASDI